MEAQRRNNDRPARHVVSGIIDVLQVESSKKSAPQMHRIECLGDFLRPVCQTAITKLKSKPSQRETFSMRCHNSVGNKCHTRAIVPTVPFRSFCERAKFQRPIAFRISK